MSEEVKQEGEFKVKHTMPKYKDMGTIPEITKVDLTKKPTEDAIQVGEAKEVPVEEPSRDSVEVGEQIQKPVEDVKEFQQIQEITEKEEKEGLDLAEHGMDAYADFRIE